MKQMLQSGGGSLLQALLTWSSDGDGDDLVGSRDNMTTDIPSNQHQKGFLFPSEPQNSACKSNPSAHTGSYEQNLRTPMVWNKFL